MITGPMPPEARRAVEQAFLRVMQSKTGKRWRVATPDEVAKWELTHSEGTQSREDKKP